MKINRQVSNPRLTYPHEIKNTPPKYEAAKNIATIFSAIAIPVVLTIAGYYIQRQLADDGLKKDYVGIAASILKENPANQEPDLRKWATRVLEENSPVPFSEKAKAGLQTGAPVIVMPGPAWLGPPPDCRKAPRPRNMYDEFEKLEKEVRKLNHSQIPERLLAFITYMMKQESEVAETYANLKCTQDWLTHLEQEDIDYRKSINAESSKSVYEKQRIKTATEDRMKQIAPTIK